jgi:hypothetical protein
MSDQVWGTIDELFKTVRSHGERIAAMEGMESAGAYIVGPDGVKRSVYFQCAACERNAIFLPELKCEGCGHDSFSIVGPKVVAPEAKPRSRHLSEVFRIVEGATRGDKDKVKAYAHLLADKLEEDGEANSAKWLRQIADGKPGARIVAHEVEVG